MTSEDHMHNLYQQVILDHNKSPRNYRQLENFSHCSEGYNPLCGDHIQVYLQLTKQDVITEISFTGQSCAICKASASLMTTCLHGVSAAEAKRKAQFFQQLVQGKDMGASDLGKLLVFSSIWRYPSRVKCAVLAWHTMRGAIGNQNRVSTE